MKYTVTFSLLKNALFDFWYGRIKTSVRALSCLFPLVSHSIYYEWSKTVCKINANKETDSEYFILCLPKSVLEQENKTQIMKHCCKSALNPQCSGHQNLSYMSPVAPNWQLSLILLPFCFTDDALRTTVPSTTLTRPLPLSLPRPQPQIPAPPDYRRTRHTRFSRPRSSSSPPAPQIAFWRLMRVYPRRRGATRRRTELLRAWWRGQSDHSASPRRFCPRFQTLSPHCPWYLTRSPLSKQVPCMLSAAMEGTPGRLEKEPQKSDFYPWKK